MLHCMLPLRSGITGMVFKLASPSFQFALHITTRLFFLNTVTHATPLSKLFNDCLSGWSQKHSGIALIIVETWLLLIFRHFLPSALFMSLCGTPLYLSHTSSAWKCCTFHFSSCEIQLVLCASKPPRTNLTFWTLYFIMTMTLLIIVLNEPKASWCYLFFLFLEFMICFIPGRICSTFFSCWLLQYYTTDLHSHFN